MKGACFERHCFPPAVRQASNKRHPHPAMYSAYAYRKELIDSLKVL
jgi:hypothetical protein